jgi:hypothetical protein
MASEPKNWRIGRFSSGQEQVPRTDRQMWTGRFSDGQEQLPGRGRRMRIGRFSDGQERLAESGRRIRIGRFSDGQEQRGMIAVLAPLDAPSQERQAA